MRGSWLALLCLGAGVAPEREELARASTALLAGDPEAAATLEALHVRRPWDDDVAYWLARARYEAARCDEAVALLVGRDGASWPTWRLRTLEAYADVCVGELPRAEHLLQAALPEIDDPAERRRASATLGLLLLLRGEPGAADALRAAGGDPALVVDPALQRRLPEALAVRVLHPVSGGVAVGYGQKLWRIDGATGLGQPWTPGERALPALPTGSRSELRPCAGGWVWSSPAEPLDEERAGVFLWERGRLTRVAATPPGALDDSPSCAGDAIWWIRTAAGLSTLVESRAGVQRSLASPLALTSLDLRADGVMVLGAVSEAGPGVWVAPRESWPPVALFATELALVEPRWAP